MKRNIVYPTLAAVLALSCSPGTEPQSHEPSASSTAPHFVAWSPANGSLHLTAAGDLAATRLTTGSRAEGLSLSEIALDDYEASFWAVRGEERSLTLNYQSPSGTSPFLRIGITDPAIRPDGTPIAYGDSILITVIVDPTNIRVALEPTGLKLGTETTFDMWWTGANGDLDGNGQVDAQDAEIEQQWLGLWYQEGADTPWTPIPAEKSLAEKRLHALLQHFSGYAVSW
jgi:hypothetical protein